VSPPSQSVTIEPKPGVSALEREARRLWAAWGDYAKSTRCHGCGSFCYCRRPAGGRRWLCLSCFDEEAQ
jgi:hypothetical protein